MRIGMIDRAMVLSVVALCGWIPLSQGQDFGESMETALGKYKQGRYTEAKKHLDKAVAILDIKRAAEWVPFFPPAPQGWQASKVEIKSPLFGGENIQRTYVKGTSIISVSIEREGLSGLALAMARPALLDATASREAKEAMMAKQGLEEVNGFLRIVKNKKDAPRIVIRISEKIAAQFKGERASLTDVRALADAMDCNRLFFWVEKGQMTAGVIGKPQSKGRDIVGKWAGDVDGEKTGFEFRRDMSMTWSIPNKEAGVLVPVPARYLVNYQKDPIQLDILDMAMVRKPILGILKFNTDGSMALEIGGMPTVKDSVRPPSLDGATIFTRTD